jgi:hypothetical protein
MSNVLYKLFIRADYKAPVTGRYARCLIPDSGETMKRISVILGILVVLISIAAVSAAGGTIAATDAQTAASLVYVSGYTMNPIVFYPYESGTITVYVTNAANASVVLSPPDLIDTHFKVLNTNAFNTKTTIGPGATVAYTFAVEVDAPDGTYYPLFSIEPVAYGNPIHSTLTVKVDSTDIRASIASKPDTFSISKKDMINVSVINPRSGNISNVLIVPESDGAEISPEESFVGDIAAGSSVKVPFYITPDRATNVTFHVSYKNGDNKYTSDTVLPLTLGENKAGAEIVVNNIESSGSGTVTLKGDVTNNGLTDAKSVLVTVGSPATPVDPNPVYAIGNLEPDDFSSFELTYTIKGTEPVPLIVTYKDAEGNTFTKTLSISASTGTALPGSAAAAGAAAGGAPGGGRGMFGSFGSGMNQLPVTQIAIILVALIALIVAWRKGLLAKLADKFRKKPE